MAKTNAPLGSFSAHGKIANTLTYRKSNGQNIVSGFSKPGDYRKTEATELQLEQRQIYKDSVEAWNALSDTEKQSYNDQAIKYNLTGFNLYLKRNMFSPTPPPPSIALGDLYQGGMVFYLLQPGDTGYNPSVQHGLIVSLDDISTGIIWHVTGTGTTGATGTDIGTGQANTSAILALYGSENNGAKICNDYTNPDTGTGVYSDWYFPSEQELYKLYTNSSYNAGMGPYNYWASTELTSAFARRINFSNGDLTLHNKSNTNRVRAIRSF